MLDFSKLYSSEYFEISVSVKQDESGKVWTGEALITRQDTGEEVRGGCVCYGNSRESIFHQIQEHLDGTAQTLLTPPPDWNSQARKLLVKHLRMGHAVTNFALLLQNVLGDNDEAEKLIDDLFALCSNISSDTISIVKEVTNMNDEERMELLTSDDDVYVKQDDPWNLDDFYARLQLFKYFINPSEKEVAQHQLHRDKMGKKQ